jgi:hypothetical protein
LKSTGQSSPERAEKKTKKMLTINGYKVNSEEPLTKKHLNRVTEQ